MTDTTTPPRPLVQVGPTSLPENSDVTQWTPQQKAIVDAAGLVFTYPDYHDRAGERVPASPAVVEKFLAICRRTGLDPLARQVYCIGRAGKNGIEWSIQTGIDGFRVVAERSKKYSGQDPFEWLTAEHGWVDVFVPALHGAHPLAARARVYRSDWPDTRPAVAVAEWGAYVQTKYNGDPVAMWKQNGAGQLAKCAEALAIRKAFPQDLSGVYTDDETAASSNAPAEPIEPTRDWLGDIGKLRDMEAAAVLREELRNAPDYTPDLWGALLARVGTLQTATEEPPTGPMPTAESDDVVDGEPEDDEHPPTDLGAHPRDEVIEDAHVVTEPEPLIPEEELPTAEQDAETARLAALHDDAEPAGDEHDAAVLAEHPALSAEQRAALAALKRKAAEQVKAPRRGFNASAMGK